MCLLDNGDRKPVPFSSGACKSKVRVPVGLGLQEVASWFVDGHLLGQPSQGISEGPHISSTMRGTSHMPSPGNTRRRAG